MKRTFLRLGLISFLIAAPVFISTLSAQEPDPDNGGNGPPVGAPVDGGALLLLAAGAAIAGKKIYIVSKSKRNKA